MFTTISQAEAAVQTACRPTGAEPKFTDPEDAWSYWAWREHVAAWAALGLMTAPDLRRAWIRYAGIDLRDGIDGPYAHDPDCDCGSGSPAAALHHPGCRSQDPAYLEYIRAAAMQCPAHYIIGEGGPDPYASQCHLDDGHLSDLQPHEAPHPLTDSQVVRWRGGGSCAGDPVAYRDVVVLDVEPCLICGDPMIADGRSTLCPRCQVQTDRPASIAFGAGLPAEWDTP